jgi:acetolactate synthase small subunit
MLKILSFVISAENHPDLLARTVMLFHRLAIPVHALMMRRPLEDSHLLIRVEVLADPQQSDRIMANLAKMVHVVCVEMRKLEAKPARTTPGTLTETT